MLVMRTSKISGKRRIKRIDVTPEQIEAWRSGVLIQVAMPDLTADEREFIMTGTTDKEWDDVMGETEDG